MRRWIRELFGGGKNPPNNSSDDSPETYEWCEVGDGNPFGVRFFDVRPLTWNVLAAMKDPTVAASFNRLRQTNGRELISAKIENSQRFDCNLQFPHNGQPLEGVVFKAGSMEVKWDIYIYDSVFLFARSWTGELGFRAFAQIESDRIQIRSVEASPNHLQLAPQSVYFLLATHAMKRVLPHSLPNDMPWDVPKAIAFTSFGLFGKYACYATPEDITKITLALPT